MTADVMDGYRWHRDNLVDNCEVGQAARAALARAKAEIVARERGYRFTWVLGEDADEGWTVIVRDAEGTPLASIGGIDDEDEADEGRTRAWQALVAVDALWCELVPLASEWH